MICLNLPHALYSVTSDPTVAYITTCRISILRHLLTLQWRHNGRDGVSNHQPHDCLLNRLFKAQIKENIKTSKPRVTGLCEGNSPVTGEFLAQRASNAENFSIWWRHHDNNWCDINGLGAGIAKHNFKSNWWKHLHCEFTFHIFVLIDQW